MVLRRLLPTKSFFRFRLRTLLILLTATALVFGTLGRRIAFVRDQRRVADRLTNQLNATVQWQYDPNLFSMMIGAAERPAQLPAWLSWCLGDDFFGNVVEVSLHYNRQIANSDLVAVGRLTNLENLDLGLTGVDDDGLKHLARLRQLRVLVLGSTGVTEKGLGYFPKLTELEALDLSFTQCGDDAVAVVSKSFPKLEQIDLSSTPITDASLQTLEALPNLSRLNLTDTGLTPSGIRSLGRFKNLRSLALNNTAVDDACLEALSRLPNLDELYLRDAAITDAGLRHLARCTKLRVLQLSGTQVSDAGLIYLGRVRSLRRLDLRGVNVSDTGLSSLTGMPWEVLLVRNTHVTWDGLFALAGIEPRARPQWAARLPVSLSDRVGGRTGWRPFSLYEIRLLLPLNLPKLELQPGERLGELL